MPDKYLILFTNIIFIFSYVFLPLSGFTFFTVSAAYVIQCNRNIFIKIKGL